MEGPYKSFSNKSLKTKNLNIELLDTEYKDNRNDENENILIQVPDDELKMAVNFRKPSNTTEFNEF